MPSPLPIDEWIPEIVSRVRERRAAVITAAPGTGKTTRVPPVLAADGAAILLQPRRIAARNIAARIALERGWTLGQEVGWQVRFERKFTSDTKLLVVTEGILTARLQQDPLLSGFRTIVLDEFHERSIHADLSIALARQTWLARDDLRLVVMSATLDTARVSAWLGDCPVIAVSGETFPLDVVYRPDASVAEAATRAVATTSGQILCFLAGAPEIGRALPEVAQAAPGVEVVPLHGTLPASEQDAALAPTTRRRIILATNIAETSLTVPGVRVVVDTGLHKVARYDPDRAIDSLELERIPIDSADQRAGRAARLAPGTAVRLWSQSDRLKAHREAEIHRIDLSGPLLEILAWGCDPRAFEWFDRPSDDAIQAGTRFARATERDCGRSAHAARRQDSAHPAAPAPRPSAARGGRRTARGCGLRPPVRAPFHSAADGNDDERSPVGG